MPNIIVFFIQLGRLGSRCRSDYGDPGGSGRGNPDHFGGFDRCLWFVREKRVAASQYARQADNSNRIGDDAVREMGAGAFWFRATWFEAGSLAFERQQPVIRRPLFRIAKDVVGFHNAPEAHRSTLIATMEIRVVRLCGFAKCSFEPLGIVVRTSTEQIVKTFLAGQAPDSHDFISM